MSQHRSEQQPEQPTYTLDEQKGTVPLGFRLISITFAGLGALLLYSGLMLLDGASHVPSHAGNSGSSLALMGLLVAATGGGHLWTAYGLWTFTPWGKRAGLYLAGISVFGGLLLLGEGTGAGGLLGLLLYGGIGWYLHTNSETYERLQRTHTG